MIKYRFYFLIVFISCFCSNVKSQKPILTQSEKDSLVNLCINQKHSTIGGYENRQECAVYWDNYQKLVQFHKEGDTINFIKSDGINLFHIASQYGSSIEILNYLLKNGVNLNQLSHGRTPLNYACLYGNFNVVKFLIENGAVIDTIREVSVVENAISSSKKEALKIIKFLIENGAELNDKEFPPIFRAIGVGWIEIIEYLLRNGANPNLTFDEKGWNTLHYAVFTDCEECVDILLKYNVDKEAKSLKRYYKGEIATDEYIDLPKGITPLEMAKIINNENIMNKLK